MKLRKIINTDIPWLVDLVYRYKCSITPSYSKLNKENIRQAFIQAMDEKNTHVVVCIDAEDKILGYIIYHIINYPMIAGMEAYVSDLLIDETCRGKGIGTILMNYVEKFARDNKCVRIMLNNPKESEGYKRDFYKKHGFTERINFANFVKTIN